MNNVNLFKCSGCSSCSLICPTKAIDMNINENGFYERKIDLNKCLECGKCLEVCPSTDNLHLDEFKNKEMYVAYAKDKAILERSSSGGLGYIIAKWGLEKGYHVCSVIYDETTQRAQHKILTKETLEKSQGSKYLQSLNRESFSEILNIQKKSVVFGTPCQIAGLHKVLELKKIRANYILIDIFCHGVPTYLLWDNHLDWLRSRGKIESMQTDVSFRYKKNYRLKIGKYYKPYNGDAFLTCFLQNRLMNKQCYECSYRRKSEADIRIGDLLIAEFKDLEISPSVVILNKEKGRFLIDQIMDILVLEDVGYEKVDSIQEKGIKKVPLLYEKEIDRLKYGDNPNHMYSRVMIRKSLKAIISKQIFLCKEK